MKTLKKSIPVILFLIALISDVSIVTAQKSPSAKEVAIKNIIDSQHYIFQAQYVTPMSGRQRYLTSDYTLYISKDTIVSDLPYFGRAYSASFNPGEGGIKFTSVDFDYNLVPGKKGGWNITIKPKDAASAQQLILSVFENGNASLQVNSNNRQPISFNGYIKRKK